MYLEINKYQKGKGNGMNKQIKEETVEETKRNNFSNKEKQDEFQLLCSFN